MNIATFKVNIKRNRIPKACVNVPLSSLIEDTIAVHGFAWTAKHYAKKGLPLWQFLVLANIKPRFGFID